MFIRKTMLAVVVAVGSMSLAHAADQGHGKITFKGSINDAPCSISADTVDQTVELGTVSNKTLSAGGKSQPQTFQLNLEGCVLDESKKLVTATFSGTASTGNTKLLGIAGSAKGASIAITDGTGNLIELGTASSKLTLQDGNNTMLFAAYLQGDVKGSEQGATDPVIIPGEFTSIADFTLAYE